MIPALSPITLRAVRSTRLVISDAARRENVINRIRRGSAPWTIRWATRWARVLVFPEPAPAMTSSGDAASPPATPYLDSPSLLGIEAVEIGGCGLHLGCPFMVRIN